MEQRVWQLYLRASSECTESRKNPAVVKKHEAKTKLPVNQSDPSFCIDISLKSVRLLSLYQVYSQEAKDNFERFSRSAVSLKHVHSNSCNRRFHPLENYNRSLALALANQSFKLTRAQYLAALSRFNQFNNVERPSISSFRVIKRPQIEERSSDDRYHELCHSELIFQRNLD